MPRQFASAATASPSRGASSSWRRRGRAPGRLRRRSRTLLIPLYSVGVFVCFTLSARSGWSATGCGTASRAGGWRLAINGFRRAPDRRRPGRRRLGEVRGRRLPRGDPDPGPRRDDAVHPAPVRRLAARAGGPPRLRGPRRRTARSGSSSRSRASTGPSSRRSTSAARSPTTCGRVFISDEPERVAADARALGAPAAGRAPRHRRVAVSGARRAAASRTSTSSTPPGRRTRRPRSRSSSSPSTWPDSWWERILYNQSAKRLRTRAARPAPHGRRQRALPARGPGVVRRAARPPRRDLGGGPPALGGIVPRRARALDTPPFSRAVLALNGGTSDERIVRLVAAWRRANEAELIARPRRRGRLDAAARRGHRRPLGGGAARPRHGRGGSPRRRSPARARPAPGSRRRARRSSTRPASGRPTCWSSACPIGSASAATSRSAGPSLRPEERAVRGLGRARADARGVDREDRHRRLRPGRRRSLAEALRRRRATRSSSSTSRPTRFDRLPVEFRGQRRPRRRHRRGHAAPGRAPRAPTSSSP